MLTKLSLDKALQSAPQETVDQLVNLYNHGQFSTVIEQAQYLTEQYPNTFIVWNILGASSAQIGKLEEAIEAYNKSIALKPDYTIAYNNMGNVLKDQGISKFIFLELVIKFISTLDLENFSAL